MRKAVVVPAILTENPGTLDIMIQQAELFCDYVQFDIMDGLFVPTRSITYEDLARAPTRLAWEAHLMTLRPESLLEGFRRAGARKVTFHYEAAGSPRDVINAARRQGLQTGIAINPQTDVEAIRPYVPEVDSVLFMTVNPGAYGSEFIPEVLDKVARFRQQYPDIEIGTDGGAKEESIARIARSGTNIIYVGSAIFRDPDPPRAYEHLNSLAHEAAGMRAG
ncbi:MAG: ribulose-phosphate 3-epimerase [Dehalococcoidia bacterium]|nr:ribulose-phosphate 3-epimerase [Dehalococcoidia bacterium]